MNKSYRTIWNESLGAWVAASELTKARGKPNKSAVALAVGAMLIGGMSPALAGPQGGDSGVNTGVGGAIAVSSNIAGFDPARAWAGSIAIGAGAFADSINDTDAALAAANGGIAIGNGATTGTNTGNRQVALGARAQAFGTDNVALGTQASTAAGTVNSVAIGNAASVTASNALAFGSSSVAGGLNSIAIGFQANGSGADAIAFGRMAQATNAAATSLGNAAAARGNSSLALGPQALAMGDSTVAVGQGAGAGSTVANNGSIAMGVAAGALVSGAQNTAIGGGVPSAMRGAGSGVSGARNVAVGVGDGTVTYDGTLDAAAGSLVSGNDNVAIGTNAGIGVTANATTSIGYNASATAEKATALGVNSVASATNAIAIGDADATGGASIAAGYGSQAQGVTSTALGYNSRAIGDNTTAVGQSAGLGSTVGSTGSLALGGAAGMNVSGAQNVAAGGGIISVMTGAGSGVTGTRNVAVGTGDGSVMYDATFQAAAGNNVTGNDNVAIGTNAGIGVSANATTSIGLNAKANGLNAIAMGTGAQATGANSISIGTGNVVSGANSGAFGDPSTITGTGSYSLGNNNTINANNAFVVGNGVTIPTGLDGSVVLGNASTVAAPVPTASTVISGTTYNFAGAAPTSVVSVGAAGAERQIQNVAAGRIAETSTDAINGSQLYASNQAISAAIAGAATHYYSVNDNGTPAANYNNNGATGLNAMAAGVAATATANMATAIGYQARSEGASSVAIGHGANVTGASSTNSIAIGSTATVTGSDSIAIGDAARALAPNAYSFGTGATASGTNSMAMGPGATASADNASAFGPHSSATAVNATSLGNSAQAVATNSTALGTGAVANNAGDVALGRGSVTAAAVGTPDAVIGGNTYTFAGTTPTSTVSVGTPGSERTITNVAAGRLSNTSTDAVNGSQLYATNQQVTQNTTAISNINNGAGIKYFHANSTLPDSQAIGTDSVAIGPNAVANNAGDIALGSGSVTAAAVGTPGATIGGNAYTFAGATPTSTVSVGAPGAERTITNVAAGRLSNTSTDAVNGSQLYATNQQVDLNTADITNLNNTIDNINNGGGIKYFHANSTLPDSQALGANSVAIGPNAVANNAGDIALGAGSVTAAAVGTGGATIGGNAYTFAGATPTSTVSVGAVGAERTITNVAAGRLSNTSTDAVNGSQLYATNQQVDLNTADITNLNNTIDNINNGGGIKYFHANSTLPDSQALGANSVAIGPNAVANNAGDIALGSGSVTAAAVGTSGATIGGNAYTFAGATPTSTVSVGAVGAERTITNVAAGRLSNTSTDAVNGSQLYATNQQVDLNTGNIATNTTNIANLNNIIGDINNGAGIKYFHANSTLADSQALGTDSIAVGPQAVANNTNSIAMGNGAVSSVDGGVALGSGSVSDRALAPVSGTITAGTAIVPYNTTDVNLAGAVSVGNAATNTLRQITNVADGTSAHDAVTIRQLQGAIGSVTATGTKYFHANSTLADSLAVGVDSIAVGPETIVNGDNGIGMGRNAQVAQTAPGGTAIGQNSLVSQADGVALGTNAQSQGIQSLALGAGSQAVFANSVALGAGSVTTVGARSGYIGYGVGSQNSVGEVSVGNAGAERQITNVAAGSAPTDAVNVSQLNQVAQNTATSLGGGASYDSTTGSYTAPTYSVGGATYNNVGDALGAQDTIVKNQGDSIANHLGGGTTYNPATGTIGGGFTVNGKTYANVADAIGDTAGQVENSIQYDNSDRSQITLGGTNGTKITNVAAGNISENSTDAVNGSQLHQTNTTVNNLVEGKIGIVKQETSNGPISVGGDTGGTTVNMAGKDGDRRITGVAEGTAPTDAVNVNQLNRISQGIDQKFAGMDSRIRAVENRANAGIASAMAMAGLPQAYLPNKSMLAIGAATFNGETGYALGLSRVSDNGSWVYKASGAASSRGDYGGAVGVGYQW
ncbi:ESPR-type extended signal peptide-containing protein [Cupriavidus sp. UGS-1]|uniref:ESPR-type extended signal peptide-containing protein n=1 Tax=Cupriavidus sp. UGS-1 TaxID=2899826 RepID=UPI001E2DDE2F|nr:ESPR-type extended signal peptide-containing protein [Cupriavidus sp. UGS-1]MCD9122706.1 YadA-like family protein [Cupriavidus sp. UGS-1]